MEWKKEKSASRKFFETPTESITVRLGARRRGKKQSTEIERASRCPSVKKKRLNGNRESVSMPVGKEKSSQRKSRERLGARGQRKKQSPEIERASRCPWAKKKAVNGNRESVSVPVGKEKSGQR
ncbi:hypothetical protein M3182_16370 [Mesobacillus maritimus]|uniref:hypothetical protein n=1 Tax=Mesobacillus maritimus TaxID=1643336 RepID=UPI002040D648|nr:hypothetical protein [Mesobacillus maritimus]MCM3587313.1 hypothetical protein [Mesobacillus maritimus]